MDQEKPTLLLVHGCFTTPACYDRLAPHLEKAGYPVLRATYPSSNPKNPADCNVVVDIEHVRNQYLLPLIEKEKRDLVLVLHSFAGVVGPAAAVGLSKTDRASKGLEGGVVGLIGIAANITQENQSLVESAGGEWPPWFMVDKPGKGLAIVSPLMETLYNDMDLSFESELAQLQVPQGYHSLEAKATAPCWAEKGYEGRLAYVRTALDQVNPPFAQDLWLESTKVHWNVINMQASHSPYVTQPEKLAEHIVEFAQKFVSV